MPDVTNDQHNEIGHEHPAATFGPLTRLDFIRYAGASGDFNPNHTIDASAQKAGYPSVFAHGMFTAGVIASYATEWLGAANVRRLSVKFRTQVWPDDVLTVVGRVTGLRDGDGERYIDINLECSRPNGEVAATAEATFVGH
jgi:acyl dehydratase